ncbi:MAG: class IV adenylate cyclase [Chloroflexi bacterium]|nr:class IV adenylate cyclase [Chloroflexota bacterium]
MSANATETEVKLYVPNLTAFEHRLQAHGAKLHTPRVYERNVRYENAEHTLTPNGIALRLRRDTRTRLTYKEDGTSQQGITNRTELEVDVSDFWLMEAILGKLGYAPYMTYEKYRTTYQLAGAEIVLDEMPFGNFVEIESDADTIERLIEALGLLEAPRITLSYTALFDLLRGELKLDFTDLTFENFEKVYVPKSTFNGLRG